MNNENRKKQRLTYKHLCDETEYEIRDGMRLVKPYVYKHETFCKQVRRLKQFDILEMVFS